MMNSLLRSGRWIFAFAIAALGAENIFCARGSYASPGPNSHRMPVLGFYGIPGATRSPDEWSSLFIAIGLWGGPWAAAATSE